MAFCCSSGHLFEFCSFERSLNVESDEASREFDESTEWMLRKDIFVSICEHFGIKPEIDLFASRLNAQLDRYVSWHPDPDAEYVDCFTEFWGHDLFYAFTLFCIVGRAVQKCIHDKAEGILIIPDWPSQPYYNLVHVISVAEPFEFTVFNDELLLPFSSNTERHPLAEGRKGLRLKALHLKAP